MSGATLNLEKATIDPRTIKDLVEGTCSCSEAKKYYFKTTEGEVRSVNVVYFKLANKEKDGYRNSYRYGLAMTDKGNCQLFPAPEGKSNQSQQIAGKIYYLLYENPECTIKTDYYISKSRDGSLDKHTIQLIVGNSNMDQGRRLFHTTVENYVHANAKKHQFHFSETHRIKEEIFEEEMPQIHFSRTDPVSEAHQIKDTIFKEELEQFARFDSSLLELIDYSKMRERFFYNEGEHRKVFFIDLNIKDKNGLVLPHLLAIAENGRYQLIPSLRIKENNYATKISGLPNFKHYKFQLYHLYQNANDENSCEQEYLADQWPENLSDRDLSSLKFNSQRFKRKSAGEKMKNIFQQILQKVMDKSPQKDIPSQNHSSIGPFFYTNGNGTLISTNNPLKIEEDDSEPEEPSVYFDCNDSELKEEDETEVPKPISDYPPDDEKVSI